MTHSKVGLVSKVELVKSANVTGKMLFHLKRNTISSCLLSCIGMSEEWQQRKRWLGRQGGRI